MSDAAFKVHENGAHVHVHIHSFTFQSKEYETEDGRRKKNVVLTKKVLQGEVVSDQLLLKMTSSVLVYRSSCIELPRGGETAFQRNCSEYLTVNLEEMRPAHCRTVCVVQEE